MTVRTSESSDPARISFGMSRTDSAAKKSDLFCVPSSFARLCATDDDAGFIFPSSEGRLGQSVRNGANQRSVCFNDGPLRSCERRGSKDHRPRRSTFSISRQANDGESSLLDYTARTGANHDHLQGFQADIIAGSMP